MKSIGESIFFLVCLILIIFAAYYFTRFFASRATNLHGKKSKMRVIDRLMLSRDKSILIVEIYGKCYILGLTNQTISYLDVLEDASQELPVAASGSAKTIHSLRDVPGNFLVLAKERLGLAKASPSESLSNLAQEDGLFYQQFTDKLNEQDKQAGEGLDEMEQMVRERRQRMNNRRQ